MPKGVVDFEGLMSPESEALRRLQPRAGRPFNLTKPGRRRVLEVVTTHAATA